jgi:ZIP family zinc transporter
MDLSNDERGWIMTCLSGIGQPVDSSRVVTLLILGAACVLGASIICIDILIRQFPGKRGFRIQDSDTFLSASLSLSFGVMVKYFATNPKNPSLTAFSFSQRYTACSLLPKSL